MSSRIYPDRPTSSAAGKGLDVTTCYAQPHHSIDGVLDIWGGLLSICSGDKQKVKTKRGSDFDQAHPNPPEGRSVCLTPPSPASDGACRRIHLRRRQRLSDRLRAKLREDRPQRADTR
jgi:hypothetical protein